MAGAALAEDISLLTGCLFCVCVFVSKKIAVANTRHFAFIFKVNQTNRCCVVGVDFDSLRRCSFSVSYFAFRFSFFIFTTSLLLCFVVLLRLLQADSC